MLMCSPPRRDCIFRARHSSLLAMSITTADAIAVEWSHGARRMPFETPGKELDGLIEKLQGAKLIADLEAHLRSFGLGSTATASRD